MIQRLLVVEDDPAVSDLLRRCLTAAGFIVPFMFVYEPALIMINGWAQLHVSLLACVSAVLGCICLAAGLHGYLLAAARIWERALLVCAALLLIAPELVSSLVGLVLLAVVIAAQLPRRRVATSPAS